MPDDASCRSFRAFFQLADQLYGVSTSTGSKAVPYAAGKMNPEGGGVVASVKRARAKQLIPPASQSATKAIGFKHLLDAHLPFKIFQKLCAHAVCSAIRSRGS